MDMNEMDPKHADREKFSLGGQRGKKKYMAKRGLTRISLPLMLFETMGFRDCSLMNTGLKENISQIKHKLFMMQCTVCRNVVCDRGGLR